MNERQSRRFAILNSLTMAASTRGFDTVRGTASTIEAISLAAIRSTFSRLR